MATISAHAKLRKPFIRWATKGPKYRAVAQEPVKDQVRSLDIPELEGVEKVMLDPGEVVERQAPRSAERARIVGGHAFPIGAQGLEVG